MWEERVWIALLGDLAPTTQLSLGTAPDEDPLPLQVGRQFHVPIIDSPWVP